MAKNKDTNPRFEYWDSPWNPLNLIPMVGNAGHAITGTVVDTFVNPTSGDGINEALTQSGNWEWDFSPIDAIESQLAYSTGLQDAQPGSWADHQGQMEEEYGPTIYSEDDGSVIHGKDFSGKYREYDPVKKDWVMKDGPDYLIGKGPGDPIYDAFINDRRDYSDKLYDKDVKAEEREYAEKKERLKERKESMRRAADKLSNMWNEIQPYQYTI